MKIKLMLLVVLFLTMSCLKQEDGQYIPGVQGPKVNIQEGKLRIAVVLENLEMQIGGSLPIRDLPNSSVVIGPNTNPDGTVGSGTQVKVLFDLDDVDSEDFRIVPSETLPDGRDFPFLIDGTLPAFAMHVPKAADMTFYASQKVFGFFLPINLPEGFNLDVFYKIKINGSEYGMVSLIRPDENGENAGVVLLLTLEDIRRNPGLKRLLKISKRNKSRVY